MARLSNKHPKNNRECSFADMQAGDTLCFSEAIFSMSLPVIGNVWMEDVS
jgi:hypothetical protein